MLVEHITPTPKSWQFDRSNTIGASEITLCARYLWALKAKATPDDGPEQGWGFGERGNAVEEWAIGRLRAAGLEIEYAGADQRTFLNGFLSGTPDGIYCNINIDIKSFDPRKSEPVMPKHVSQVEICSELTGCDAGLLIYINASDYQDKFEVEVPRAPEKFEAYQDRARAIMSAPSWDGFMREGWIAGGDECKWCQFRKQCLTASGDEETVPAEAEEQIASLHAEALAAKTEAAAASIAERTAREKISEILRANGARRAPGLARVSRASGTVTLEKPRKQKETGK